MPRPRRPPGAGSTLTTLAALVVLGMFVMFCRARRVSTSIEDATLAALHRVTSAAPHLREGLNQESADKTAPHLRELLSCVAVGIVDADGTRTPIAAPRPRPRPGAAAPDIGADTVRVLAELT